MSTAPPAAEGLAYRPFRDDDLPGVLRLWEEESGWGAITPEQWRKWYVDRPDGACLVAVAEDGEGRVVGQAVFAPTVVRVDGEDVPAVRLGATILARATRRGSIRSQRHPMVLLYRAGARAAAEAGFRLVYALPEQAWLPLFRWGGELAIAEHPCAVLPLSGAATALDAAGRLACAPAAGFGAEHDALWAGASDAFPIGCGVDRSAARLRHRIAGHLVLEAREADGGALVGYAAVRRHDGLLEDVLARTPAELVPVLGAVAARLAEAADEGALPFTEIKAMASPAIRPALEALGFAEVDYRFAFVCAPLDPSLPADRVAPERWYLAPGD